MGFFHFAVILCKASQMSVLADDFDNDNGTRLQVKWLLSNTAGAAGLGKWETRRGFHGRECRLPLITRRLQRLVVPSHRQINYPREPEFRPMSAISIPKLAQGATNQDLARGLLAISDVADQLSRLIDALRNTNPDSVLTGCVRRMAVSLRSILVENKGCLFTRFFQDGSFPRWPPPPEGMLAKVVVDASFPMEIEYEIEQTGERRRLRTPPYRHGFVVNALHGIGKCEAERFVILTSTEIWTRNETADLANWLRQPIFEVDGLVYDLKTTIKTVADKEGAHIDQVVDSEGIYTGNREIRAGPPSNDEVYVRSRLIKFGPFPYPHIVVLCVARYLATIAKASLTENFADIQSLAQQMCFTRATSSAIRERLAIIKACPSIGRIEGFPLHVIPERLVMRPPIGLGLDSFDDEQRRADRLPEYGETCIGAARDGTLWR